MYMALHSVTVFESLAFYQMLQTQLYTVDHSNRISMKSVASYVK